jgi:selenide,water dikinase
MRTEMPAVPARRDLVLVGGGHSHVAVLKAFGMRPQPGVRITLVTRDPETPYSGMLPGVVAGHYTRDEAHIDLGRLARFARARAVFDDVVGLDASARRLHLASRPSLGYDLLSLNVGSTPDLRVPGAGAHATPVKPVHDFLARWDRLRERLLAASAPVTVAVVGAGAGGVELVLAMQHRVASENRHRPGAAPVTFHLFSAEPSILPTHAPGVARRFARVLASRGVVVHAARAVTAVDGRRVSISDGSVLEADEVIWGTQASAPSWLGGSGLALDEHGFVRVSRTLQSISHEGVFAAGDVAAIEGAPRPKSGVFAVRQGPPLAENLRRAARGQTLRAHRPQVYALGLISTGDRYAVASRGALVWEGAWVWRWKDWIDRRFMARYANLPAMSAGGGEAILGRSVDDGSTMRRDTDMRCAGCGAKLGSDLLHRVLDSLDEGEQPKGGLAGHCRDDAAVLDVGASRLLVQSIDFFRAPVEDPFVLGQLAAAHALGDVYAMGASAQTALALVTVPYGPPAAIEDDLRHVMAGVLDVLRRDGVSLAGGHSTEGAELACGLSVTGIVDPQRVLRKSGLRPGDRLILTKALGTGALLAADMRARAKGSWIAAAVSSMVRSNRDASVCLVRHGAVACTDVTGFGLAGHLTEMLDASSAAADIDLAAVPWLEGAQEVVAQGIVSSLQPENERARRRMLLEVDEEDPRVRLLFDPQTSGGLLAAVPPDQADECLRALRLGGDPRSAIVGTVRDAAGTPALIRVR